MNNIAFKLPIFANIPPETVVRDFLLQYLEKNHNVVLERKCIILKKNTLSFTISPIIKSKLLFHHEQIILETNTYLQEKNIQLTIKQII
jgi:hypothetical protein